MRNPCTNQHVASLFQILLYYYSFHGFLNIFFTWMLKLVFSCSSQFIDANFYTTMLLTYFNTALEMSRMLHTLLDIFIMISKPETSREASYFIVMLCSVLEPVVPTFVGLLFFHICGHNRLNLCNIPAAEFCFRGCRHHCVAVCAYVRACVPAQAERACVCGVNLRSTKICLAFWNLKFGATKGINWQLN